MLGWISLHKRITATVAALFFLALIACGVTIVIAQATTAPLASFPNHFVPSNPGAGVEIDCGGTYPGLRGSYLCSIEQTGNTITVTRQVPDNTEPGLVRDESFTFTLGTGGTADGVVTGGAFNNTNTTLNLSVNTGGTISVIPITVPAALRVQDTTLSYGTGTPSDVVTGTGSVGTDSTVSRSDHSHGGDRTRTLSSSLPLRTGTEVGSAGSSSNVSRQDHDHQMSAFAISRLLPDAPSDNQIARYDSSSSSWTAEDLPGGGGMGVTTFTGLDDTPGTYTGESGDYVRVNAASSALEFIAEPANHNTIPHVGRIPAVTATSPDLIFLTHDEVGGAREDATLTIGNLGNYCGYADNSIFLSVGSINEPSPISSIEGVWDSANSDCTLTDVYTTNEGWLDDQAQIVGTVGGTDFTCDLGTRFQNRGQFVKRITSCTSLEDVTQNTLTFNFLSSDTPAVAYWTDGSVTNPAGLYEKVGTPPAYHDIRPIEESHRAGQGSFACGDIEPPDDGGQVCIDSDGRASFSTDRTLLIESEPEITAITPFMSDYWLGGGSNILEFNSTAEPGEFKWYVLGDIFFQMQGTRATGGFNITGTPNTVIPVGTRFERDGAGITYVRTTAETTIPAGGTANNVPVEAVQPGATGNNIPPTATFTPDPAFAGVTSATIQTGFSGAIGVGLTTTIWPTLWQFIALIDDSDTAMEQALHESLRDDSVFLGEFSQLQDAAEDRDGYASTTDRYFYLLHGEEDDMQEITGFTASESTEIDDHQWVGPVVTIEDVHDIFEVNPDDTPTLEAFSSLRVGDNIYSAIVRPDETTGDLRDPVAADWDTPDGFSRSVAWDGNEWLETERYFAGAHSADALFTQVAVGTEFTFSGDTYRWRGESSSASPNINPRDGDFIYYTGGNTLREYVVDSRAITAQWVSRNTMSFLARELEYQGAFGDQDSALAHIVRDDQRVIYERSPERARGVIRFVGQEGTDIPIGTRVTAQNTTIEFETIEGETIPAGGEIDLDARAVVGGSNGNVVDDTVFTHSLAGLTGATAEGAFTRGDNVAGGYRLFLVTNFEAPSSAEYTYRWKPLGFADDIELVIGPDRATGLLRDATDDDYDEFHAQSGVVAFDGDQFQKVSRRVVGATQAMGTWTTVADTTAITGTTHRWRGTHWQDYLVPTPRLDGDVYYNRTQGFREYDGTNWHNVGVSEVFSSGMLEFLGSFLSQQLATDFATQNGQWALIEVSGVPTMQELSGYSGASPEHYEYYWVPVTPPFPNIPLPSTGSQDDLLRYNSVTADWRSEGFVTGDSLDGIGTQGNPLVVDVHDVLEQVNEHIQYTTNPPVVYTNAGATLCNVYMTGPYPVSVTSIRVQLDPESGTRTYRASLWSLFSNSGSLNVLNQHFANSNTRNISTTGTHTFTFTTSGVALPADTRIGVCLTLTNHGNSTSTRMQRGTLDGVVESYDDASVDFVRLGWAEYETNNPSLLDGTRTHDTDLPADPQGNMTIYYRRTFDHGTLVGDGNVDLAHLADDVTERLLPASPTNDQVARYDTTSSAWVAEDLPAGLTGTFASLTDTPATITASECVRGNTAGTALEFVACGTGGGTVTTDTTLTGDGSGGDPLGVANPFTAADEGRLLPDSPTNGQIAVYNSATLAWEATARTGGNPAVTGEVLVDGATYGWQVADGPSQEVHFSRALTADDDAALIHIDWREWATTDPGDTYSDAGVSIVAAHVRQLSNLAPALLVKNSGGDTPIDRGETVDNDYVQGAVAFKFPQSGAGHPLSDMRLIYIGDHVDDLNENVSQTETDIDVDSSAGMVVGRNYWFVGPTVGVGCSVQKHAEKVELVSIVTGTEITVTRDVDDTGLPDGICSFAPGGDVIEDNKRYFNLVASSANQDNAAVTFRVLGSGSGDGDITSVVAGAGIAVTGGDSGDATVAIDTAGSADGQVLTSTGDGTAPAWEAATGTQLTEEEVEDFVGGMVSGNTETGIAVTYQDTDGTLDFDVQTAGDARYAQLGADNTLTGHQTLNTTDNAQVLTINASGVDNSSVFRVNVPTTGGQVAFQTGRVGEVVAWASFDGNIGGDNTQPGIALGSGTSGRDVNLYRGGSNLLKTDDAFEARSFDVPTAIGTNPTRLNLDIVDYATGTAFPANPIGDDVFEFNDSADSLTGAVDYDGSSAITSAVRGDVFKYDSGNTQWVKQSAAGTGGGSTTFLGLTDTPATFGTAGQLAVVNAGADGIAFTDAPAGTGDITGVTTAATSGLSGGADTGTVVLTTDWEQMTVYASASEDVAAADDLLNLFIDDVGGQRAMSVSVFGDEYASAFDFTDLGETPNSITANQCLQGNAGATELVFGACGTGGGTTVTANPAGVDATDARLTSVNIGGTDYYTEDVIFADQTTGVLRAVATTDWNATTGQSRVLAFDGQDIYRASRQLVAGHTASATFTEIADDATIPATDEQCIWRGFHHSDRLANPSPVDNNCYYNLTTDTWRWRYTNGWFDVTSYLVFRGLNFRGLHSTQAEALAAVSADGQYVGYTTAAGHHGLYTTSAFTAGETAHYEYAWKDAGAGLAPDAIQGPVGPVIAETAALATTGIEASKYLSSTDAAWSLTSAAPTGVEAKTVAVGNIAADRTGDRPTATSVSLVTLPLLAPDDVMGLWVDLQIDGTLRDRKLLLWGASSSAFMDSGDRGGRIGARMSSGNGTFVFAVWNNQPWLSGTDAEADKTSITLGWSSATHPANTTIHLRLAYSH